MKYLMLPLATLLCIFFGCTHSHDAEGDHAHDAQGNHITPSGPELEALAYTIYSNKTELFVEFEPPVVGQECRFAAHFTALGDVFKAIDEGTITLSLVGADSKQSVIATEPEVPGIFRLRITPEKATTIDLVFDIKTPAFTDQITIKDVEVYPNTKAALADQAEAETNSNNITYLKEQAWRVEFANAPALIIPFREIVKSSGQILTLPGDEALLTAQISGVVTFSKVAQVVGSAFKAGTSLFTLRSNEVVQSNLGVAVTQAENDLAIAQKNFDRASELVADKIISDKEFLIAKSQLMNAQTQLDRTSVPNRFNRNSQQVSAPINGFLKNLLVENGQYVEVGQPLASMFRNRRVLLRADVSQRYFAKLATFNAANFKIASAKQVFSTHELNGKLISTGKSVETSAPFVPLYFEIDNPGSFIPGSMVELFLQSTAAPALVIPKTALLEEQGIFYAYVQIGGESFQKRELKIGASDGVQVQVLTGIAEGERVVIKGGFQIKLSTATGALPAHGHEH